MTRRRHFKAAQRRTASANRAATKIGNVMAQDIGDTMDEKVKFIECSDSPRTSPVDEVPQCHQRAGGRIYQVTLQLV